VLDAVKAMNKKGYKTVSSGFAGAYGERQQIDGSSFVDDATKGRLALMGVSVSPYPLSLETKVPELKSLLLYSLELSVAVLEPQANARCPIFCV
jgi:hypothetical protein